MEGLTSIKFERGEFNLIVRSVPAHVCPNCGEAYLKEEIAVQVLKGLEEISTTGMLEAVIDYKRLDVM